jgi:alpha-N-arabinofuranosidase
LELWGYYSEDGLGILEYFQWAEKFTDAYGNPTRLIWVINNGVAHTDSIPSNHIDQWIQDALDSVEFVLGNTSTKWGGLRASMGHPAPFRLDYLAIGNEDCGKPYYNENYQQFYDFLSDAYPDIKYVANCNLSGIASTDIFDYHTYPTAEWFYENQNTFDDVSRTGPAVFNSEYAVHTDFGTGNLKAALGEAVWMSGLERNSDIVIAASYAPLFVNWNDYHAKPDAINFNSHQSYGSVSYYVQQLFATSFTGLISGSVYTMTNTLTNTNNISVSVTKGVSATMTNTEVLIIKIISYNSDPNNLAINLANFNGKILSTADFATIQSPIGSIYDENSFADPKRVATVTSSIQVSTNFNLKVAPYSVNSIRIYISSSDTHVATL